MAVLLDTHTFLWWCDDSPELSAKARRAVTDNACFVSLASFWEIAIKISMGKLTLPDVFERYLVDQMSLNGFDQLDIGFRHLGRCATLPFHHRDPFDRLLACQALEKDLPIVSRDPLFVQYGIKRIW